MYSQRVKRLSAALTGLCLLLSACASQQGAATPPAPPAPPAAAAPAKPTIPTVAATTPQLRTDTVKRHQFILTSVRKGGHEIAFLGASIMERWETVGKENWNAVWLPRHAVNCGISGDRTQHVLARLDDGLLDALAAPGRGGEGGNNIRWFIINIGSNNLSDDSAPDVAAGIEAIITRLRTRLPDAHIALSAVLPRGQHPTPVREKAAAINALLTTYLSTCEPTHVHLMDMGPKFLDANGDIPADLMPDFLHPSATGYRIWSDELEKIIR